MGARSHTQKRYELSLLAHIGLLAASCFWGCEDTSVHSMRCDLPCYTGPTGTENRGTCHVGRAVCVDDEIVACVDEVVPGPEYCMSGLDTNCDGRLGIATNDPELGAACNERAGSCHAGAINCVDRVLVCLGASEPHAEDCSGRDLDCDGVPNNIEQKLCYSGKTSDLIPGNTECRAGITSCVAGQEVCLGERRPQPEVCGAQRDFNCNGVFDDVDDATNIPYDVIVAIDRSASMSAYYSAMQTAVSLVAKEHETDGLLRFAVIYFPNVDMDSRVALPFSAPTEFVALVESLDGYVGAFEVSYDVLHAIEARTYDLTFRPDARVVIWMFADEEGQAAPNTTENLAAVRDATLGLFAVTGDAFYGFTMPEHYADYQPFADRSGGSLHSINQHGLQIRDLLRLTVQQCR